MFVKIRFWILAKTNTLNQTCGGPYGLLGKCREGLRCTADEEEYERGANITGVCYQPNCKQAYSI